MNKKTLNLTLSLFIFLGFVSTAKAASDVDAAINSGSFDQLQQMLQANPDLIDPAVRSLLQFTQANLQGNPEHSTEAMTLAALFAPKISPSNVPPVCAEVRRIVSSLPQGTVGSPLYTAVVSASQSFAKAPVVVAAGRPKLCEEAWLEAANMEGEVLLAEQPHYPPIYPPIIKPSAD